MVATKETWERWRTKGIVETDAELLDMMSSLCAAMRMLDRIDAVYNKMAIDSLMSNWYTLQLCAHARRIANYPRPSFEDAA